jgi:hypothetical protein
MGVVLVVFDVEDEGSVVGPQSIVLKSSVGELVDQALVPLQCA